MESSPPKKPAKLVWDAKIECKQMSIHDLNNVASYINSLNLQVSNVQQALQNIGPIGAVDLIGPIGIVATAPDVLKIH